MMPRGSGDHQHTVSGTADSSIGKIPCRYAPTSVAGSRSPPAAMRSSAGQSDAGGNRHRGSPTGVGVVFQPVTPGVVIDRTALMITRVPDCRWDTLIGCFGRSKAAACSCFSRCFLRTCSRRWSPQYAVGAGPAFQRSTLRVLPRGHLQWRGEEYLRDVNSALAGFVRAQTAAAVIVGCLCVCGFMLIGVPSALSMGIAAGILELIPALGPLTALIMTAAQAGDRVLAAVVFL